MRAPSRLRGQVYYRRLIETIYTGLEGRDVSDYAWDDSDGWTQSRTAENWTEHLECWADLGGSIQLDSSAYKHSARLMFALRYAADDDSVAQARMHAAIRDACEFLLALQFPDGVRAIGITGATIDGVYNGGFAVVTVAFTLRIPR